MLGEANTVIWHYHVLHSHPIVLYIVFTIRTSQFWNQRYLKVDIGKLLYVLFWRHPTYTCGVAMLTAYIAFGVIFFHVFIQQYVF